MTVPFEGLDFGLLGRMERELRLPLTGSTDTRRYDELQAAVRSDPDLFLDVIDFLVGTLNPRAPEDAEKAGWLEETLDQGGSAWQVVKSGDTYRLTERIDKGAQAALNEAMAPSDRASRHLSTSVSEAYGRKTNPSNAYREAVRAVEAIAKPTVLPLDGSATLGKMISAMKDKPSKWSVVLSPSRGDPVRQLVAMMELLWTAQLDRHGTDDENTPLSVGPEEARAAVHIAATLVQLFRSGAVKQA